MVRASSAAADMLDPQKIRFVDVDGVRTRYYEDGAGEPLVLFHGGHFGEWYSLDCWSLNLADLAKHFHVYAVDKLGQGHTDNPKSDADYTFEALFRHALGFVQAIGITEAHFLGHSRGALLVAMFAFDNPELVKTLIIVDSNTLAPDSPIFPGRRFYTSLPIPPGPPTREGVRVEPDAQAYSKAHITDDFIARMLEVAQLPKSEEARGRAEVLDGTVWMPSLGRKRQEALRKIDEAGISVPTLIIWGANDLSAPLPLGYTLFERIAMKTVQAEMHVLNGAGHYSFREQPRAFVRVLRSFCLG